MQNNIYSLAFRFTCYDCVALFLLAASLASRGRVAGQPPTGCILVGLVCASLFPLIRELFVFGSCLAYFSSPYLLGFCLLGALAGTCFSLTLRYFERLVRITEILALTFVFSFATLCFLQKTSVFGSFVAAFFVTCFPLMACDVALGDTVRFLSESTNLMRAVLCGVVAIALILFLPLPLPPDCIVLAASEILAVLLSLCRFPRKRYF